MKIINMMASSLDGSIARYQGEKESERHNYKFTNTEDQKLLREEVKQADAIIMGANTLRASEGLWLQRRNDGTFPLWLIFSNRGLPADHPIFQETTLEVIIAHSSEHSAQSAKRQACPEYLSLPIARPARRAAEYLVKRGVKRALLLGGEEINTLFYEQGLVDEVLLTLAPVLMGSKIAPKLCGILSSPCTLTLLSSQKSDDHVFLRYSVDR